MFTVRRFLFSVVGPVNCEERTSTRPCLTPFHNPEELLNMSRVGCGLHQAFESATLVRCNVLQPGHMTTAMHGGGGSRRVDLTSNIAKGVCRVVT